MENCSPQLLKEVLKRGRAYRCLLCDNMTGEKRYVKSHIYKYHIPLDTIPYYCSLCHFQTDEEDKLKEHITIYKKHTEARESLSKAGKTPEPDQSYLHKNKNGIIIQEDQHFEKLNKEESRKIWMKRLRDEKGTTSTPPTCTNNTFTTTTCTSDILTHSPAVPTLSIPDLLDIQDPVQFFNFLNADIDKNTSTCTTEQTPAIHTSTSIESSFPATPETPKDGHTCTSTPVVTPVMQPKTTVQIPAVAATPEASLPDTMHSSKEIPRTTAHPPAREHSPTRFLFDILNQMHHMQNTLQNIHHEMKTQTDVLRAMREDNYRRHSTYNRPAHRTSSQNTYYRKRSRTPAGRPQKYNKNSSKE